MFPPNLHLAQAILVAAAVVAVPLGLRLIRPLDEPANMAEWLFGTAQRLSLPGALLLAGAIILPVGGGAAVLAIPWLGVTLLVALAGSLRLRRRIGWREGNWAESAGMIYLAIGGAWAVIARAGWRPLELPEVIVLLTGVHFHYAGFVLPLVAFQVFRRQQGTIGLLLLASIVVSVPLVGAGIVLSARLEVAATLWLVAACWSLAAIQIRIALAEKDPLTLTLLLLSSVSLIAGMALAACFAVGEYLDLAEPWIDIPAMIPLHGLTNALGFALCGLIAWQNRLDAS